VTHRSDRGEPGGRPARSVWKAGRVAVRRPPGDVPAWQVAPLRVTLERDTNAPWRARTAIRDWSEHMLLQPFRRYALELLVSEIVTNAVRHAEACEAAPISLAASFDEDEILVTVTDGGRGLLPRMRTPHRARGGYGLHMVDRESRRWGVDRAAGTSVWFAI
jgi:anti-sigma regulatory factor (Ser/Thr protein kinase)